MIGLAALIVGVAARPYGAPVVGTACPVTSGGARLSSGQVIDGPPVEMAILKPEGEQTRRGRTVADWPVGYVYDQGRNVYLTCAYAKRPQIVVRVAKRVTQCRYVSTGHTSSLACR